jgi:hypothetical protein
VSNHVFVPNHNNIFINSKFITGFDGCHDTPVEILHVILLGVIKYITIDFLSNTIKPKHVNDLLGSWQSFDTNSLDLPVLNAAYLYKHHKSMVGKDYKIVLQCAPFVFFQFMNEQQRKLWHAMCKLAPYIFQTHISNMETYLQELEILVDHLLLQLMNSSARWVNKPKFHMLIHLVHSIKRFGPASLFATEKFESFNSILRNASVHSNRQHPGKDLAVTFSNFYCLRAISSGAYLYNHTRNHHFQASNQVTSIFENEEIQHSMGYVHSSIHGTGLQYPIISEAKLPNKDKVEIPPEVRDKYPNRHFLQECCIKLDDKRSVRKGYFVQLKNPRTSNSFIGQVHSIWKVSSNRSTIAYCMQVNQFELAHISDYYHMRTIKRTPNSIVCSPQEIIHCLNVQHNCHEGGCKVKLGSRPQGDTHEGNPMRYILDHKSTDSFIINSCSFQAPEAHREISSLELHAVPRPEFEAAIRKGLNKWQSEKNIPDREEERFFPHATQFYGSRQTSVYQPSPGRSRSNSVASMQIFPPASVNIHPPHVQPSYVRGRGNSVHIHQPIQYEHTSSRTTQSDSRMNPVQPPQSNIYNMSDNAANVVQPMTSVSSSSIPIHSTRSGLPSREDLLSNRITAYPSIPINPTGSGFPSREDLIANGIRADPSTNQTGSGSPPRVDFIANHMRPNPIPPTQQVSHPTEESYNTGLTNYPSIPINPTGSGFPSREALLANGISSNAGIWHGPESSGTMGSSMYRSSSRGSAVGRQSMNSFYAQPTASHMASSMSRPSSRGSAAGAQTMNSFYAYAQPVASQTGSSMYRSSSRASASGHTMNPLYTQPAESNMESSIYQPSSTSRASAAGGQSMHVQPVASHMGSSTYQVTSHMGSAMYQSSSRGSGAGGQTMTPMYTQPFTTNMVNSMYQPSSRGSAEGGASVNVLYAQPIGNPMGSNTATSTNVTGTYGQPVRSNMGGSMYRSSSRSSVGSHTNHHY